MQLTEGHRLYWRKNLTITTVLLAIWFIGPVSWATWP